MAILKYTASIDTTITDAYKLNLITRATGSNLGSSNSLEIFSIYGQSSKTSLEKSRILIKFPTDKIISDRASTKLPPSGNVNFILKMYNAEHPFTLPDKYYLKIAPVSQSWTEGYGLDMEGYTDPGANNGGYGANWVYADTDMIWQQSGGTTSSLYNHTFYVDSGEEDLSVDITDMVEAWVTGSINNNGILIKLADIYEDGTQQRSFYTKKFFARSTGYFYKVPTIEAQWDSSVSDDRNDFYASSSLLTSEENTHNLYFYNFFKGTYRNIPGNPSLSVKFYLDINKINQIAPVSLTITNPNTGIYKASVCLDTTSSVVYDYWVNSASTGTVYYSSSFDVNTVEPLDYRDTPDYIINITNLKAKYLQKENVTFRIYSREKNWSPNVYNVSSKDIENKIIDNLYYKIYRVQDRMTIIDYSITGIPFTKLSQDLNGSYFTFDMSILEADSAYAIKFAIYDGIELKELPEIFKFRVE
jgi:hypothetical protein